MPSLAAQLAALPDQGAAWLDSLTPEARLALRHDWRFWGRPEQFAPGTETASDPRANWRTWLVLAGRGFGKTRAGAEWVRERVNGGARWIIIAGPTASDVRDVMIEGESGILAIYPPGEAPVYESSKARLTWYRGKEEIARATLLSAEEPERFRGKQGDTVWADELCAWERPEAWTQLRFGMRLGSPRFMVTTTPKNTPTLRDLLTDARTVVTRGSTFDNAANLAPEFIADIRSTYEGTRLGRQELYAEVLLDTPGALWNTAMIEACRVASPPAFLRTVTALDPSVTANATSDEAGIVTCALGLCRCKGAPEKHLFVIGDYSGKFTPDGWARETIKAHRKHSGDRVVAEKNQGGDMIENTLRSIEPHLPYRGISARQGKRVRAEPIAAIYEQGKAHHVGDLHKLEAEMCTWDPMNPNAKSPNRIDALVHCATELMLGGGVPSFSFAPGGLSMNRTNREDD